MKLLKIISTCIIIMAACFFTFKISKTIIDNKNLDYVPETPFVKEKTQEKVTPPKDIDKLISHIVKGTGKTTLPVKSDKNFIVYEGKLYVTNNQGKSWLMVPDDDKVGYARISEYIDTVTQSNVYTSNEELTIVYGGRGSENISIITTDSDGKVWSVGSISKTATHDLQKGYDKLYIDFIDDGKTGYIAAIRNDEAPLAFRSVNSGVTWDHIENRDTLYGEIMNRFGL
ncbi:hypothetical protein [Virgibacillus oceani]|uniref:Uncharacterized protein n=1 Tax=Virgibacillus oceani TaxID=1479511 RepID=A0A917M7Q4_9BACI|nr:hypothetical protein [Virgibacillus oceani]GGG84481.1 hypothetical protein GCM10011398_32700 [Virgibacillus oceani]